MVITNGDVILLNNMDFPYFTKVYGEKYSTLTEKEWNKIKSSDDLDSHIIEDINEKEILFIKT